MNSLYSISHQQSAVVKQHIKIQQRFSQCLKKHKIFHGLLNETSHIIDDLLNMFQELRAFQLSSCNLKRMIERFEIEIKLFKEEHSSLSSLNALRSEWLEKKF